MPEVKTPEPINKKDAALKVLQEEEQANMQQCSSEIGNVLQKYGYALEVQQNIVLKRVK